MHIGGEGGGRWRSGASSLRPGFALRAETTASGHKVITTPGPRKPQRTHPSLDLLSENCQKDSLRPVFHSQPESPSTNKLLLETSFTSLQSPSAPASNASSSVNGFHHPLSKHNLFLTSSTKPNKTMSLDLPSAHPGGKIDLIHDDWFGLAPLASPESLSELSSISSRASFLGLGLSLTPTTIGGIPRVGSFELKTPKVMRRTPKINNNLSTCADDIKNVRYYEKLGQISKHLTFDETDACADVTLGLLGSNTHITNSSSNLSYESASSHVEDVKNDFIVATSSDDFQSVEDILDSVMQSAGCADFFNSKSTFLETHFDEAFELQNQPSQGQITLTSPLTPTPTNDPDLLSNFAIDLTLDSEHRSQASYEVATTASNSNSKANSIDSGSMCRTPSDHAKNVTFNPQVINIEELRAPQCSPKRRKWNFMSTTRKRDFQPSPPSRSDFQPKTILSSSKRRNSFNTSDEFFSRSEALPLLTNLGAGSERTSPNFVRRKKYVYPTGISYIGKGSESSV